MRSSPESKILTLLLALWRPAMPPLRSCTYQGSYPLRRVRQQRGWPSHTARAERLLVLAALSSWCPRRVVDCDYWHIEKLFRRGFSHCLLICQRRIPRRKGLLFLDQQRTDLQQLLLLQGCQLVRGH